MQDAIDLLLEEHQEVRSLCQQLQSLLDKGAPAQSLQSAAMRLKCALLIHGGVEDEMFYPAARTLAERTRRAQQVALEEHRTIRWQLSRLQGPVAKQAHRWRILLRLVDRHLRREEQDVLPAVRQNLGNLQAGELATALGLLREAMVSDTEDAVRDDMNRTAWPDRELRDRARLRQEPLPPPRNRL